MKVFVFNTKGGVGNQLFIHNMAHYVKEKVDKKAIILYDTSYYFKRFSGRPNMYCLHYGIFFVLNKFFKIAQIRLLGKLLFKLAKINRNPRFAILPLLVNESNVFWYLNNSAIFKRHPIVYFSGHWINKSFLNKDSRLSINLFCDELEGLKKEIKENNSVAIHIRGKQYVAENKIAQTFASLNTDYYTKAINYIKNKISEPVFFVFSNDVAYAKKILKCNKAVFVNEDLHDYQHFYLMSICNHQIIANSTFSFWAAYIDARHKKIVICPSKWSGDVVVNPFYDDLPLDKWIKL